ncbi:hypothetical protein VTL71DRAFT_7107 [Oculimacula yallundae]|uniref:Uncharacterized protein n=1 Tax=Oculimacula yallundae TaxID=86028 RepID=A0ABR4BXE9_9HELO
MLTAIGMVSNAYNAIPCMQPHNSTNSMPFAPKIYQDRITHTNANNGNDNDNKTKMDRGRQLFYLPSLLSIPEMI